MTQESINRCIVCNSDSFSNDMECKDHFVTQETFSISRCNACGFRFTNPRPCAADAGPYYESEKYVSHSKTSKGLTNSLFHLARRFTLRSKKRIASKYTSSKHILDYGCGTGEFLNTMNISGWSCVGIEPNDIARKHAINVFGLDVLDEASISTIDDASLDCITLWHVLEHVYPINDRISSFHSKLNADGTLIVALPNMNSFDAKRYGPFWAAYDVPRHIYHFTPETIKALMVAHGFRHVKTKPMLFDSFYISMLSEKYKHGSGKFLRAMFFGFLSNLNAWGGKRNYSSLIYIFKKSI